MKCAIFLILLRTGNGIIISDIIFYKPTEARRRKKTTQKIRITLQTKHFEMETKIIKTITKENNT